MHFWYTLMTLELTFSQSKLQCWVKHVLRTSPFRGLHVPHWIMSAAISPARFWLMASPLVSNPSATFLCTAGFFIRPVGRCDFHGSVTRKTELFLLLASLAQYIFNIQSCPTWNFAWTHCRKTECCLGYHNYSLFIYLLHRYITTSYLESESRFTMNQF